jgi:hypothetical protein
MKSWREVLKIHPAAELFPLMGADELRALGEDIKANGLRHQIVTWKEKSKDTSSVDCVLLDGRNRLDAMEAVGIEVVRDGHLCDCGDAGVLRWRVTQISCDDPYAYVISANIHRRHLTTAQKGELIGTLLKARPERSDRATAKIAQVSDKTVGKVRERLEGTAEIPQLKKRAGADGKIRKPSTKTQRRALNAREQAIARGETDPLAEPEKPKGVKIDVTHHDIHIKVPKLDVTYDKIQLGPAPTEPPQSEAPTPAIVDDPVQPAASPSPREQFEAERDAKVAGIVIEIQKLATSERLAFWRRCAERWHKEIVDSLMNDLQVGADRLGI